MAAAACVALSLTTLLLCCPVAVLSGGQALTFLLVASGLAGWRRGPRALLLTLLAGLPVVNAADSAARLLAERWRDAPELAGAAVKAAAGKGAGPKGVDSADTLISGTVCEFAREQPGSWRFVLTSDAASRARGLPGEVLVNWYQSRTRPAAPPEPGQQWRLALRLRPPRGLANPGGFDYERWLFTQHIGATGWVRESPANGRLGGGASPCPAAAWRAALARRIATALDGREAAPYVLGLALGAYQALPEAEWARLRRTGTIHLISISGFHVALVVGPAALLGLVLARTLLAAGRRCRPRVLATGVALLVACVYGALAGFSVPLARSLVAVGLVAVLAARRRAVTGPELLAAVILGVLLIEPFAPLVPGFWLSFAGVIILAATGMSVGSGRARPGPVRLLLLTQAGMTAGLAPLLVLFFGQLPLSGALANLVAVPAFSLVLLPLTLLGAAAAALSPVLAAPVLGLAANCFDLWRGFLGWCADLPLAVWYLPEPAPAAVLLALAGASVALWPRPFPGRPLGLGMLLGLLAAGTSPPPAGGLRVTVLDVGQGLAVLVQTGRHALLYDAGPAFRNSDAGQRVVVPALQALGVAQLDTLLLSHADADHRGGAASVLERYPARRLLGAVPGDRRGDPCEAGDAWHWDGFEFEILHPLAGAAPADDNAGSCVLRISGGGTRVLLPGDVESSVERELVSQPEFGLVDLVVAPHHGSRTSSTAELVQATRPRYVIFSTGYRNRWHFPAAEVIRRWQEAGACVLDTAEEGALQFEAAPGSALRLARPWRRSAPGVWLGRPPGADPCG